MSKEPVLNKPARMSGILSICYVSVSLSGLFLLAMLTLNAPISTSNLAMQKQLTGSIFGGICILGALAGIGPSKCLHMLCFKRILDKSSDNTGQSENKEKTPKLRGHHPACGKFSSHIIELGGRTYCAGCMGLVIGAMISLVGNLLYFFVGFHAGEAAVFVFWSGFFGITCGLLQYYLPFNKREIHSFLNVVFVFGSFLLLIGVDEMRSSLILNSYLLTLIVYWIFARIALSQIEHEKICSSCSSKSCVFSR